MSVERVSDMEVRLTTPIDDEDVRKMKIGDHVLVTGVIYSARDAAHNRMIATLNEGKELPIDIKGQLIYYVGPSPTRPGKSSGAFGPTTSMRMDPFTPPMLAAGLKVCMGKGNRGPEVQEALKKYTAVYLMAVGGAAAMLAQYVKKIEVVAYEDLGTESIKRVEVVDFPAYVMDDCEGRDLLMEGRKQWRDMSKLGSYKPSERIIVSAG